MIEFDWQMCVHYDAIKMRSLSCLAFSAFSPRFIFLGSSYKIDKNCNKTLKLLQIKQTFPESRRENTITKKDKIAEKKIGNGSEILENAATEHT